MSHLLQTPTKSSKTGNKRAREEDESLKLTKLRLSINRKPEKPVDIPKVSFLFLPGRDVRLFMKLVPKVVYWSFFICWLNNFGDFYWILICLYIKLIVQTFNPIIVIYRRGNFVYYNINLSALVLFL